MRGGRAYASAVTAVALLVVLNAGDAAAHRMHTYFASASLAPQTRLFLLRRAHDLLHWSLEPSVLGTVLRSNASDTSHERVVQIDAEWQAGGQHALASELLANACAQTLRALISGPKFHGYREAFVTDADGELVCATERTSDYWQGDEEKWVRAFAGGRGAIYVGPAAFDESVGLPLIQLAVPVVYDDAAVGVLVVGKIVHNLDEVEPGATASLD